MTPPVHRGDGSGRIVKVEIITTYVTGVSEVVELTGDNIQRDQMHAYPAGWPRVTNTPDDVHLCVTGFTGYEHRRVLPAWPVDLTQRYEPAGHRLAEALASSGLSVGPGSEIPLDGRVEPEPCRKTADVPTVCTNCGHTGVMHPGSMNPALRACLLCQLENVRDDRG